MKLLVSPLAWYLLAVLIGLLVLRRATDGRHRRIANGLMLFTLLIAFASTPLVGILLDHSLQVHRTSVSGSSPQFIFVLSGGYSVGNSSRGDVLNTYTAERVRHGVNEWQSNKGAQLVLSGSSGSASHGGGRDTELMARAAAGYGVPDSVLVLEARSRNTREHPVEALRIPGVTPTTHVAVVTSSWHMRRARREFCRHFERIDSYPVPPAARIISLVSLAPRAETLGRNTTLLREWFGILWYTIRGAGVEAVGDCLRQLKAPRDG